MRYNVRWLRRAAVGAVALEWITRVTALGQGSGAELVSPWQSSVRVGGVYSDNRDGTTTNTVGNLDIRLEPQASYRFHDADRTWVQMTLTPLLKWRSNPRTAADGAEQHDSDLLGSVDLEGMHFVTPTASLSAGDRFSYSDDPGIVENGITVRRNESYVMNTGHAGLNAVLTPESELSVSAAAVTTRYQSSDAARELDSDQLSGQLSPSFLAPSGWRILALVGVADFDEAQTVHSRGSTTMTYDAGAEKSFTPDVFGKVLGGYQVAQYDNPELESVQTANGSAEIAYRPAEPTRFGFRAEYGYTPPSISSYSLQRSTTLSGTVDHDLIVERLTVRLDGRYVESDHERESADAPGGMEKMAKMGAHVTCLLTRRCSLTGGYSYENWDSQLRESFRRNLVDVSATLVW